MCVGLKMKNGGLVNARKALTTHSAPQGQTPMLGQTNDPLVWASHASELLPPVPQSSY